MNIIRNSLIVSLLVVLVLPTSFAFAAGIEDVKGVSYAHCPEIELAQANSLSYSGDDLYDSAADLSGSEVDHEVSFPWEVAVSFPCAEASADINSFTANPELSVAQFTTDVAPVRAEINTFTANPELSVAQFTTDVAPVRAEINTFTANPELSVSQRYADAAPVSAEINTLSANPLSFWSPQIYAGVAPVSADINTFSANPELSVAQRYADVAPVRAEINTLSANPLSFWSPQIYADVAPVSAETKDCYADCYDNY